MRRWDLVTLQDDILGDAGRFHLDCLHSEIESAGVARGRHPGLDEREELFEDFRNRLAVELPPTPKEGKRSAAAIGVESRSTATEESD